MDSFNGHMSSKRTLIHLYNIHSPLFLVQLIGFWMNDRLKYTKRNEFVFWEPFRKKSFFEKFEKIHQFFRVKKFQWAIKITTEYDLNATTACYTVHTFVLHSEHHMLLCQSVEVVICFSFLVCKCVSTCVSFTEQISE